MLTIARSCLKTRDRQGEAPADPQAQRTEARPEPRPPLSSGLPAAMVLLGALSGCAGPLGGYATAPPISQPNPLFVPTADREFLWNQVVDTIDDYFKIQQEERVRQVGEVLTEGRISTYPVSGSTLLEPWRGDSTSGFERLHSTLQSVRRRAEVRVLATQGGYLVDVTVLKELEDLAQPLQSTVGRATSRHESSPQQDEEQQPLPPGTLGWIPLGRDISLEQRILVELRGRLGIHQ